jgi:cell division transport system permease protein
MRIGYLVQRTLKDVFQRWRANLGLTIGLALSFLVLDAFIVVTMNLWDLSQRLKGDGEMEIFLKDDVTSEQTRSLRDEILKSGQVEKAIYHSKSEAFAEMEDYLGAETLRGLDSSTFPASFQVSLKKKEMGFQQLSALAGRIGNHEGVEGVEFAGEWWSRLNRAIRIFVTGDMIFGALVGLSVITMVSNFMRVAMLTQAKSIRVMSLLGASRRDIYLPLLGQGMILGGSGAWLSVGLGWTVYALFSLKSINLTFIPFYGIAGLILWGILLGAGGTYRTVKRQM